MQKIFDKRLQELESAHRKLIVAPNEPVGESNGIIQRYKNPILTAKHTPLFWRYDLHKAANPYLMERIGINAVLNAGAIKFDNKYVVVARVEGSDRKSFFAVAESNNGIDNFRF
ncbi:MAG TPA: glycosidase, partial [Chitinophagaceae bacterium]|nr:glycosidase [Chitinophagaceae bacterium]